MTLGDRLRFIRNHKKLTLQMTCDLLRKGDLFCDISAQVLNRYEKNEREPKSEFLQAFCTYFKVNGHWMLCEEGEVFLDPQNKKNINDSFLELFGLFNSEKLISPEQSKLLDVEFDQICQNTPENFAMLLNYMIKDEKTRCDMFKFFHILIKPSYDQRFSDNGVIKSMMPASEFQ